METNGVYSLPDLGTHQHKGYNAIAHRKTCGADRQAGHRRHQWLPDMYNLQVIFHTGHQFITQMAKGLTVDHNAILTGDSGRKLASHFSVACMVKKAHGGFRQSAHIMAILHFDSLFPGKRTKGWQTGQKVDFFSSVLF